MFNSIPVYGAARPIVRPSGLVPHLAVLFGLVLGVWVCRAHSPAEEMAEAANNFLAALNPEQRAKASFEFKADERYNWHFIPRDRKGLPLKEMTAAQRSLAHGLLNSGLSNRGYLKATTIMSLEEVLRDLEQGKGPARDPERYFFSIFGHPGGADPWGWRVEGHHLSLNFAIAGEQVTTTPSFFGSNPAEVRAGPRQGLRVLGVEEDLGFKLLKSLTPDQQAIAIITTNAPQEIITGANRQASLLTPPGLPAERMTDDQRKILKNLLQEYVFRHRPELAREDLAKIGAAGIDKVHFAWAGASEPGKGHYYRLQGPTFLMEFDNTQNNANHIHTVWRDFKNDFGEDILRRHYEQVPHGK